MLKPIELKILISLLNYDSNNGYITFNELVKKLNIQKTQLSSMIKPLIIKGIVKQAFLLSNEFKKKSRAYKLSSEPFTISYLGKIFLHDNQINIFQSSKYFQEFLSNLKNTHLSMSSENYIIDNQLLIEQFEGGK